MKNIQGYQEFSINESSQEYFIKNNLPVKYRERVKRIDPNLSNNPRVMSKVRNFFQKWEDRISSMGEYGTQYQQMRRAERGGGPNTGIESLFGISSIVPNILKRVFGPTKAKFGKVPDDDAVDVNFMRHTNEDFARSELPKIKTEEELANNIGGMYKKAGVNRGDSPILDEILKNRANMYYARDIDPSKFHRMPPNPEPPVSN